MLGLINNGNTCYLNSSLQLLTSIQKLYNVISGINLDNSKNLDDQPVLAFILKQFTLAKWQNPNKLVIANPIKFHKVLSIKTNMFNILRQQEDAHETLVMILHNLEEEMKDVKKIFDYKIKNSLVCKKCNYTSETETVENMVILHKAENIIDSIINVYKAEKVEYCCEKCKHKECSKRGIISTLPKCFIFCINRFNKNGIKKDFEFDFFPILVINKQIYKLRGFICHTGKMQKSGHYFFIGRTVNGFNRYDDSTCTSLGDFELVKKMFNQDVYILLYELD